MRLYLMPASGLNSKVVTTGPGLICTTVAEHVELFELGLDAAGGVLQLLLVVRTAARRLVEQLGGRQVGRALSRGFGASAAENGAEPDGFRHRFGRRVG